MMPKLVCYDKNTWKTLQQLSNWNRNWGELFTNCLNLQNLTVKLACSFVDDQFVKCFLEGVAKVPNIKNVNIQVCSKNDNVEKMLEAFKKANIFNSFEFSFRKFEGQI